MNLPIFLHNGGTHTPHFQILRFEWCRFFWLLLLLERSLRNKLLVPLASEQKWAKLERLHVTSKSWLYVRVTVENYANKLNYSSACYQLSLFSLLCGLMEVNRSTRIMGNVCYVTFIDVTRVGWSKAQMFSSLLNLTSTSSSMLWICQMIAVNWILINLHLCW